jgi:hypothetical protein
MLVVTNPNIKRLADGLHHVKWNGQWTSFGATSISKAESHLAKLQQGLVRFEPIRVQEHRPAFKPGFCNGASRANRLHQTL